MKVLNPPRSKPCDDDGGPSFPVVREVDIHFNPDGKPFLGIVKSEGGRSLRDDFAIAALQGLCSNPTNTETVRGLGHFPTFAAAWAYRMADACLDERAKGRA